jgi:hypothetical protein
MMVQSHTGRLRTVAALALCALFLLLAMGLTLLGSGVYRGTVAAADENDACRTALSYLANQVRRGDTAGGVVVGALDGVPAVALSEGEDYVTYLYCYDGQLRELYTQRGSGLTPADGLAILPLDELVISLDGPLLTFTAGGSSVSVSPRCGVAEVDRL